MKTGFAFIYRRSIVFFLYFSWPHLIYQYVTFYARTFNNVKQRLSLLLLSSSLWSLLNASQAPGVSSWGALITSSRDFWLSWRSLRRRFAVRFDMLFESDRNLVLQTMVWLYLTYWYTFQYSNPDTRSPLSSFSLLNAKLACGAELFDGLQKEIHKVVWQWRTEGSATSVHLGEVASKYRGCSIW